MPTYNRHYSPWLTPLRPVRADPKTGKARTALVGGVPQPEVQVMTVKATMATIKDAEGNDVQVPRVVYDAMGNLIPTDHPVQVPVSAGTVLAVQQGDLEEMEEVEGTQRQPGQYEPEVTPAPTIR